MKHGTFGFKAEPNTSPQRYEVWGDVTEGEEVEQFFEQLRGPAVLDLAAVRRFNSTGIRLWVRAARAAHAAGVRLTLERCSHAVVTQLNMVVDFLDNERIASVMAPYFCEADRTEHLELIPITQNARSELERAHPCPKCGVEMIFDDDPDNYLSFMDRLKRGNY